MQVPSSFYLCVLLWGLWDVEMAKNMFCNIHLTIFLLF